MDQNPIVGWLKVAVFAILCFLIWMNIWQGAKTEDKIVRLEQVIGEAAERARENERVLSRLDARNEILTDLIAEAGIGRGSGRVVTNGDGRVPRTGPRRRPKTEWGWELNAHLDADLDPSRPVGTPGRHRNFLKLDPDMPIAYTGETDRDATFAMGWGSEPKGFNFLIENYATLTEQCEAYVLSSGGSRHWKRPSSFNWHPELAWRVEVNDDHTEYVLFLRHDAYWHRPPIPLANYPHLKGRHKVTAHDIEFTYKVIMDPQSNCAVTRSYLEKLDSVEALDDYTVVFRWKETSFSSLAYTIGFTVMPKHIYANDEAGEPYPEEVVAQVFNDHWYDRLKAGPVGCGPYRFVEYEAGKYIKLERWDDWFGFKDSPRYAIRHIHYKIFVESELNMNRLRKGEIDVGGLSGSRYREWVLEETDPASPFKNGDIEVSLQPRTGYLYIGWKNTDDRFKDKRVRQALTYACNRQEICEKIFLKRYKPMASPIFPDSEEADPSLEPYPFDPEKAKRLLDEAGWKLNAETGIREKNIDGKTVELKFKLYWPGPSAEFQNALDHVKNDYQNIGIIMEPQSVQWTQFQKQLRDREYSAFSLLWVTNGWEHDFGQIWHSSQIEEPTSSNYIEFSNAELDQLQDKLRTLMDPEERIEVIHRIGNILYEEQPYTFFGWQRSYFGHWKHVKNTDKRFYFRPFFRIFPLYVDR